MFTIRPFTPIDEEYTRVVEINNKLWPDDLNSIENLKYDDAERNPKHFFQRLIIELNGPSVPTEEHGKIIGEAWCGEDQWIYDPGRYKFGFRVDPQYKQLEYGKHGIGIAVLAYLLNLLNQREPKPKLLITHGREDKPDRLAFLKEQGYTIEMRFQDSELDVTTFDPSPFLDKIHQVKLLGVEILPLSALRSRFNDWMERLYEMDMEILPDEPTTGEFTPQPIEEYAKLFKHPAFLADGWMVALDGGTCVGSSSIWNNRANPQQLYTNFTGVRRSHRRKGVALALKLALIEYVRQRGATSIITNNEENNPMYQINVQLGFKPRPGWLEFHKRF